MFKRKKEKGTHFLRFSSERELKHPSLRNIELKHFDHGFVTEPLTIYKRSYAVFEFSQNLGENNEFVMLINKEGEYLGRFVHVLAAANVFDLLKEVNSL